MRENKFRAWAYASRIMFFPNSDDGWEIVCGIIRPIPNTILMQFTALKDKNGTEIYEGDIIKIDDYFKGEVKFSYGAFRILDRGFHLFIEPLEVIGNIYENPELLGGTQKAPENSHFEGTKNDSST